MADATVRDEFRFTAGVATNFATADGFDATYVLYAADTTLPEGGTQPNFGAYVILGLVGSSCTAAGLTVATDGQGVAIDVPRDFDVQTIGDVVRAARQAGGGGGGGEEPPVIVTGHPKKP